MNDTKNSSQSIPEDQGVGKSDAQNTSESQDQKTSESGNQKAEELKTQPNNTSETPTDKATGATKNRKTDSIDDANTNDQQAEQPTSTDGLNAAPTNPNAHWYVVHSYSGHEQKVANTLRQRIESLKLQDKILDIIIPTQDKIEIKEGKKSTVKEKIFPGYLLVNMVMDDNSWVAVRTTPGITGFIGTSTKPTPLPEEEVKTIKRYMTMEAPKFKTTFTQGEAVKITDGPFSEFLGTISDLDETKGKLKVLVSVFGRETPVELDFLQVAKL